MSRQRSRCLEAGAHSSKDVRRRCLYDESTSRRLARPGIGSTYLRLAFGPYFATGQARFSARPPLKPVIASCWATPPPTISTPVSTFSSTFRSTTRYSLAWSIVTSSNDTTEPVPSGLFNLSTRRRQAVFLVMGLRNLNAAVGLILAPNATASRSLPGGPAYWL
ncbi:hypothetical protein HMN09_00003600 [Mycena chlorophos]|uniref:Uncharacterized protein n=1 Tax=Mycena chlorophos TaxID=658473 RepID=A0A8H6WLY0_MYCCL|nr:hypothetical protein HMN09_00003600 [Mycena chlorophos]